MNDALYFRVRADGQWLTPRDFERACERFESRFLKTAMPLYVHHADHGHLRLLPIGTGFLLAVAERRFLVTARHVIDGFVKNDQLVLTNNITGDRFTTRAPRMFRPTGRAVDFALLPLDDKDVEHLTGMEYVGLGSLALTDQSDPNVFRLIGYPQDLAKDAPQYRTALHVSAHLAQVPVPAALGLFEPDHHLLL